MRSLKLWTKVYLGLVAFSLLGSFFSSRAHLDPGLIAPVAASLTLLVGCVAVYQNVETALLPIPLVIVFILGLGVELVGVSTGYPFGHYQYTTHWAPTVPFLDGRFPLLLPVAWLLMAGAAYMLAQEFVEKPLFKALLTAAIATLVDFIMEPVMAGPLDYWRWKASGPLPGGAAILNPIGWFAVAFMAGLIFAKFWKKPMCPRQAAFVLTGHIVLTMGIGGIAALSAASPGP